MTRGILGVGTLACPSCDAPVVPARALSPTESIACPYPSRTGRVREFLSLAAPARPTRVEVRIVDRAPRITALPTRRRVA